MQERCHHEFPRSFPTSGACHGLAAHILFHAFGPTALGDEAALVHFFSALSAFWPSGGSCRPRDRATCGYGLRHGKEALARGAVHAGPSPIGPDIDLDLSAIRRRRITNTPPSDNLE